MDGPKPRPNEQFRRDHHSALKVERERSLTLWRTHRRERNGDRVVRNGRQHQLEREREGKRTLLDLKGGCNNRIRGESNPFRLYGGSLNWPHDLMCLHWEAAPAQFARSKPYGAFPKWLFYPSLPPSLPQSALLSHHGPPFFHHSSIEKLSNENLIFTQALMHLCCSPICTSFTSVYWWDSTKYRSEWLDLSSTPARGYEYNYNQCLQLAAFGTHLF